MLAFLCNWAAYRCYMGMCRGGAEMPSRPIFPIKVPCSGRVDPAMVLRAFEKGAEGVMVLGCKERECRYGPGPRQTERMEVQILSLMRILGLEPQRFFAATYGFHESERLLEDMHAFVKGVSKLGETPLKSV